MSKERGRSHCRVAASSVGVVPSAVLLGGKQGLVLGGNVLRANDSKLWQIRAKDKYCVGLSLDLRPLTLWDSPIFPL